MSVFAVFLVFILPIWKEYGPEKLQIWTHCRQCSLFCNLFSYVFVYLLPILDVFDWRLFLIDWSMFPTVSACLMFGCWLECYFALVHYCAQLRTRSCGFCAKYFVFADSPRSVWGISLMYPAEASTEGVLLKRHS